MTLLALLAAVLTAGSAESLEVRASLGGAFLYPPQGRCCPFTLHLKPSGELTVDLLTADGHEETTRTVSPEVVQALLTTIQETEFFTLSQDLIRPASVDGDVRSMRITLGGQTREIDTMLCPVDARFRAHLDEAELDATLRACRVWTAIRGLIADERAQVF